MQSSEAATMEAVETSAAARLFSGGTVLCDGAMGSMLYSRGIFINRCYDELNVTEPDLIREVHTEYLQAGAVVIESNTFGANALRLERYGLEARVHELNMAGVRLARECVERIREKHGTEAFVAGAIGPLGTRIGRNAKVGEEEAYAAFAEQVRALAEGGSGVGADLLVIETLTGMTEAGIAIRAAKREGAGLPVIVMVTVDADGNCLDGTSPEDAARQMTEWGADAVGCNCSEGPGIVLSVIERMEICHASSPRRHAQRRNPQGRRGPSSLSFIAGVYGELCPEVRTGRGYIRRRVLRHDPQGHPCHAWGSARPGGAADRC